MGPLVSIVMPAYNAEHYIAEAIRSVLAQTYTNWELLIVNDGSTDGTRAIMDQFSDPRIRTFDQANGGIGSARNLALEHAQGVLMCGLDADDVFPPDSVASRVLVFAEFPDTDMVDGGVLFMDGSLEKPLRVFEPTFTGDPFHELVALRSTCFMGFSWMVRWNRNWSIRFIEHVSHGEDLCFYLAYSPGRMYRYTRATVLLYRRTGATTMVNLDGLARSYARIYLWLLDQGKASHTELIGFRRKTRSIMMKSFLRARQPLRSLQTWLGMGAFAVPPHAEEKTLGK